MRLLDEQRDLRRTFWGEGRTCTTVKREKYPGSVRWEQRRPERGWDGSIYRSSLRSKVPLVLMWEGEAEGQPDTYMRSNMETLTQISQRCFKSAGNRDVCSLVK